MIVQGGAKRCRVVQKGAGWHKKVQDGTRRCRIGHDSPQWRRLLLVGAGGCRMVGAEWWMTDATLFALSLSKCNLPSSSAGKEGGGFNPIPLQAALLINSSLPVDRKKLLLTPFPKFCTLR